MKFYYLHDWEICLSENITQKYHVVCDNNMLVVLSEDYQDCFTVVKCNQNLCIEKMPHSVVYRFDNVNKKLYIKKE